jgi:hypothetical protein
LLRPGTELVERDVLARCLVLAQGSLGGSDKTLLVFLLVEVIVQRLLDDVMRSAAGCSGDGF